MYSQQNNLNADQFINNEVFESVGVEVKINSETYAAIWAYCPPSSSLPDFNKIFSD